VDGPSWFYPHLSFLLCLVCLRFWIMQNTYGTQQAINLIIPLFLTFLCYNVVYFYGYIVRKESWSGSCAYYRNWCRQARLSVAQLLAQEQYDVVVIEKDEARREIVKNSLDV